MKKVLLAVPILAALGGCQFWLAGHSDDNGEVVSGEGIADPGAGTTTFNLVYDGSGLKCEGESHPKPGEANHALVTTKCEDGRTGKGESYLLQMDTGEGHGTDSCGNGYYITFSTNKTYIDTKLQEFRKKLAASGNEGNDKCNASLDVPPHTDPLI